MEKKVRHSIVFVLALLIIAVFGSMTAFAYTAVEDDGSRDTQDESSMHKVYCSAGMLRMVDVGTTVALSADHKTVNIEATTSKSKTWGKITKLAFAEQTATAEEKDLAANEITFEDSTYYEDSSVNRKLSFSIPVADVGKKIPVCRYQANEWKDFSAQAYMIVLLTDALYDDIAAAVETETDEAVKADLQAVLDTAKLTVTESYMFNPDSVNLLENETGWFLRIVYGKTSFTKAFLGYVCQALDDDTGAIAFEGDDGKINIPVAALKENLPIAIASAKNGYGVQRDMVVDKVEKTVTFKQSDDILLQTAQTEAIAALESKYKPADYSDAEKTAIEKVLADAKATIEAATIIKDVDKAKEEADKAAAAIKSDATKKAEKDAAAKEAAAKEAAAKDAAAKEAAAKAAEEKKAFEAVKTSAKKPKAAKKSFTAKWSVVKGAEGYEVKYGLNKKVSKKAKTKVVKKAAAKSVKIKGLKAKKTYYVKVRAYKTINKVKVYSKWSAVKKVKTK